MVDSLCACYIAIDLMGPLRRISIPLLLLLAPERRDYAVDVVDTQNIIPHSTMETLASSDEYNPSRPSIFFFDGNKSIQHST